MLRVFLGKFVRCEPRTLKPVMPVGDIKCGNVAESIRELVRPGGLPDRLPDAVRAREIVDRLAGNRLRDQSVDFLRSPIC